MVAALSEDCKDCHVLTERVTQLEKRIFEKFEAERLVRDKIELALNAKLEVMNGFRVQIDRMLATFVTWPGVVAAGTFIALIVSGIVEAVSHIVTK